MHAQDTPHPTKTEYRGADWAAIQRKWSRPDLPAGRAEAPRRGAPPAAPYRLGSRTHFDTYADALKEYPGPSYLVIAKGYGENGGKVIMRTMHERPSFGHHDPENPENPPITPKSRVGTPRSLADPVNLTRASWRARSQIEDWVRMTCTKETDYRLGTGTRRGGFATLADVNAAVAKFRRQIARHYPGVTVLSVPELHHGGGDNDGKFHVHMILVFPAGAHPLYSVFHRLWYRALGGSGGEKGVNTPGNFDFAKTHGKDGRRYTACQAARYIAKYVTKDLTAGKVGEKRFTKTHLAAQPVRRYWWQPIAPHDMTRAHVVSSMRTFYPGDRYMILGRTFNDGGDTFHVFSAEPIPD